MTIGSYIVFAIFILLVVFLSFATWFIVFRVWPYFTGRSNRTLEHTERNQHQLLEVLGIHARSLKGTETAIEQMVKAITYHTAAIQRLADDVKRPVRKRPPSDG